MSSGLDVKERGSSDPSIRSAAMAMRDGVMDKAIRGRLTRLLTTPMDGLFVCAQEEPKGEMLRP